MTSRLLIAHAILLSSLWQLPPNVRKRFKVPNQLCVLDRPCHVALHSATTSGAIEQSPFLSNYFFQCWPGLPPMKNTRASD